MPHTHTQNYVIALIGQAPLGGGEHGFAARNTPGHPPLAELWRKQRLVDEWYIAWSERLSEAALGENVHFTLIGGHKGGMTRPAILPPHLHPPTYHPRPPPPLFYPIPP